MPEHPDTPSEQVTGPQSDRGSGHMFDPVGEEPPPPEQIGDYRILHEIGSGGMGTVYAAIDEATGAKRRVALKIVKRGVDTHEVLKRFRLERQVMGSLDHPNIARFFSAGETEDGRPYFVMEFIEGQRIDAYCDANNLSIRGRTELFLKICAAVHYAHTNLIVHRDIKPGNILVTPTGEPKLLDFGIAKLLNPDAGGVTVFTGPDVKLMTPEYASPEQARGQPVNTLSDVYSLGVLLYELLTGRRPYRIESRMEAEIIRVICETDPDRPSTLLARIAGGADPETIHEPSTSTIENIARHRGTRPDGLRRQLSGDLDDIIMMSLAKAPLRRYPSAQLLADDLRNFLDGQPVLARKARRGAIYKTRKFVKRHPAISAASVAGVLALAVGGSLATWQWREAEAARAAEQTQRVAAEAQREVAVGLAENLWSVSTDFLGDYHREIVQLPGSIRAREQLITKGREQLEKLAGIVDDDLGRLASLADSYELLGAVQADLRSGNRGDITGAMELQERALELRRQVREADTTSVSATESLATSLLRMGDLNTQIGQRPAAREHYDGARELLEAIDGEEREQIRIRAKLASALDKLGEIHMQDGEYDEAEALFERGNELRRASLALVDSLGLRRNVSVGMNQLADLHLERGRVDEALGLYQRALQMQREIVNDRPEAARYRRNLANTLSAIAHARLLNGEPADAIEDARESLRIIEALLEEEAGATEEKDVRHLQARVRAHLTLGRALLASGDAPGSAEVLEGASRQADSLSELSPDNVQFDDLRRAVHSARCAALIEVGWADGALRSIEVARAISTQRSEVDPALVSGQRDYAVDSRRRADALVLRAQGDDIDAGERTQALREARENYQIARSIRDDLGGRSLLDPLTISALEGLDGALERAQALFEAARGG